MTMPLYSLNDNMQNFLPQVYPIPDFLEHSNIFTVPIDNAIVSENAPAFFSSNNICIGKFKKNSISKDEVIKCEYLEGVLPAFNDRYIPANANRSILLFDLKEEKFLRRFQLCNVLEERIKGFGVIDGDKLIGMAEILLSTGIDDGKLFLRVYDFSGERAKLLAQKEIAYGNGSVGRDKWFVFEKKIFIYREGIIKVFDQNFKETTHLFVDLFNRIFTGKDVDLMQVVMHPTLPLAIIDENDKKTGENKTIWLLKWDSNSEKCIVKSIFYKYWTVDFSFSPDGKWLVFNQSNTYYTMPVDASLPNYLGKPIKLGSVEHQLGATHCWTRNPLSYVRKGNNQIFRWEFDKIDKKLEVVKKLQEKDK